MIGSMAGFAVFLVLMLLAVQVLFDLYARSAVTAAAFDAARRVAGYDLATLPAGELAKAQGDAEAHARHVLGRYGDITTFSWDLTATDVKVRVRVTSPELLPAPLGRILGIDRIDRTVRVHAERLVCPDPSPCGAGVGPSSP